MDGAYQWSIWMKKEGIRSPTRTMPTGPRPLFVLPDGLGGVGFLNNIVDIGTADRPAFLQEQHARHIDGEGKRQEIGLRGKGKDHLPEIRQKEAEHPPHAPGQGSPGPVSSDRVPAPFIKSGGGHPSAVPYGKMVDIRSPLCYDRLTTVNRKEGPLWRRRL